MNRFTIKQIKKDLRGLGMIRAWKIFNNIFAQDKAEDGYFFKITSDGKVEEVMDFPMITFTSNDQMVQLQGVDFMEDGDRLF